MHYTEYRQRLNKALKTVSRVMLYGMAIFVCLTVAAHWLK